MLMQLINWVISEKITITIPPLLPRPIIWMSTTDVFVKPWNILMVLIAITPPLIKIGTRLTHT